jgi:hypothetical protein
LHFLNSKTDIAYQDITLNSVFMLVGEAIANCFNPIVFSAFVGLLMVGIFLAVIRTQIENSLGLCIGFHASWVWQIKMSKSLFDTNIWSDYIYLVGSYDAIVGPLVTGWLLLEIIRYFVYQRINKSR